MRLAPWLWSETSLPARWSRVALAGPSALYGAVTALRARAYAEWRPPRRPADVAIVSVGNLTVGGTGKTPLASWIARYALQAGRRPAILLRGYGGGDEGLVHHRLVPGAMIFQDPDRLRAGRAAAVSGADLLILDDGFQRLDMARDLNVLLVAAESGASPVRTLPAGPWREPWSAARRADFVIVTHRSGDGAGARALADRFADELSRPAAVIDLALARFRALNSNREMPREALRRRTVLISAGIGDPGSFVRQCAACGASVTAVGARDHQAYDARRVARLTRASRRFDYVVITEKDAVKLRHRWPAVAAEPLVGELDVRWDRGRMEFERALDRVLAVRPSTFTHEARRPPVERET